MDNATTPSVERMAVKTSRKKEIIKPSKEVRWHGANRGSGSKDLHTIGVKFLDQTMGRILAKRLQEAEDRMAKVTGYRIRMMESEQTQLRRLLPNTNPWSGSNCGRPN